MMRDRQIFYQIVKTKISNIAILWYEQGSETRITEIILPKFSIKYLKKKYRGISPGRHKKIERIATKIKEYISGKKTSFTLNILDLKRLKNFQRKVLSLTSKIQRGKVESYGSIAKKLGIPKGARAVGQALAHNPFPIIIPCHRVIKSDGSIGGFGGNIDLKRKLLKIEGVGIK
ncbi:MAG: methylated-DNA--[protein]-cysteine S-methyltransferase [candidate division WOR-3 bacterium]